MVLLFTAIVIYAQKYMYSLLQVSWTFLRHALWQHYAQFIALYNDGAQ
jgi:hypothetical protein